MKNAVDAALSRWRLVLGEAAAPSMPHLTAREGAMDVALSWLYGREQGEAGDADGPQSAAQRNLLDRSGSLAVSQLTVPDWINAVHQLFPRETIERLERDAIERYHIDDVITRADVLQRVQPSRALLRAVLRLKHLMDPRVLKAARELVAKVVAQLLEQLEPQVRAAWAGQINRRRRALRPMGGNFDFKATIKRNLAHYDPALGRIALLERLLFFARTRRSADDWQMVLLVDQSGSMLPSVIHAAVTAACLRSIPGIKTHLVAFDTAVVDFSDAVADPVELLMRVQLGGGTNIAQAVEYAAGLIKNPRRAVVVVISDFYEGASPYRVVAQVRALVEQGSVVLALAALDQDAVPAFDRLLAAQLADVGAHVGAMTPGALANFIADKVHGR